MGEENADSGHGRGSEAELKDGMPSSERRGRHLDDSEETEHGELKESGRHHKSNRTGPKEDKEYRSREQDRSKSSGASREKKDFDKDGNSSRDRRKDDRNEREKDKHRAKDRGKDYGHEKHREASRDKDRMDRENEKESEHRRDKKHGKDGDLDRDKDREREKNRGKEKDREKERDRRKDRDLEILQEKERVRDYGRDRDRDSAEREKLRETRENEMQVDKQINRDNSHGSGHTQRGVSFGRSEDADKYRLPKSDGDYYQGEQQLVELFESESKIVSTEEKVDTSSLTSTSQLEERIQRMKEERLMKSSEGASEVLSWVSKSRILEEKMKVEKEKALKLSKIFEEQDNIHDEESDEEAPRTDLSGVRVLHHGLEKVAEGAAIVLTLKDQSILADGDVNEETDVLESVEIGEQKRRQEAYKAAKKKTSLYDDKFNDEAANEKKILPQYDDPAADEFVTLDSSGHFTGDAERKLEELRKRIQGASTRFKGEDLNSSTKVSSDYYTEQEMIAKFKKPKKKKALRKKEKLDIDALEAEAKSSGLGSSDLGSRDDGRRQNLREKEEMIQAEAKSKAYQLAYAKADEASKALRLQGNHTQIKDEEDDDPVFGDDDDELQKSLQRARKLALENKEEKEKPPQLINILSAATSNKLAANSLSTGSGDQPENKVVFTEVEEFVWGLQLDEEENKFKGEDVFMEEDEKPISASDRMEIDNSEPAEVEETTQESPVESKEEVVPDDTIHEASVGKGLAGALKLLKDRGTLKESVEWGGRNMDKKRSKLSEIQDNNEVREIRIERTDEYGRTMTPKESFRQLSHKFHGKGPGKMKQEKRMRQYQEELKVKRMKNADTPSLSVERMREAQAKLQTPYLVLSGNAKPGQSNDPGSGFATVEKDFSGGLTPMLGDKKVEHFLNIKRKP